MRALYISYDGMTDPLGESQVIPYLISLSKKGIEFTILSAEKKKNFLKRKNKISNLLHENHIKWNPISYHATPPVFSAIFDLFLLKSTAIKLHRKEKFHIVHCRSYIPAMAGLALKKKYGVKFVFDMRGFWADERVEGGVWNIGNPVFKKIYRFFKNWEKVLFSEADYTISLTEEGKKIIHSWKHISNQPIPIQVIPCCTDFTHFNRYNVDKIKRKKIVEELKLQNRIVLTYLGSVGTWYMLDEMLMFFKVFSKTYPNAVFLFITRDHEEQIINKANYFNIEKKKIIVRSAERKDVPTYLSVSDLAVFFIKPVFSKKASSPTKQGEIMGMGIPLVCNSNVGDVDSIIQNTGTGIAVSGFNTQSIEEAVQKFKDLKAIPKETIIAAGKQYYDLNKGVEKYYLVYKSVLND